jgi:hypothetical protein
LIVKMHESGFTVVGVVCDNGPGKYKIFGILFVFFT